MSFCRRLRPLDDVDEFADNLVPQTHGWNLRDCAVVLGIIVACERAKSNRQSVNEKGKHRKRERNRC